MELDPQLLAVLAVVALAGVYVARRLVREWAGKGKAGCGGGCGCSATKPDATPNQSFIAADQLTVRRRPASPP